MTSLDHSKVAAFILTHGRADNCVTFRSLQRAGWTKPIYLIIDNEDDQADLYRENFGEDRVIQFDKEAISHTFDLGDTQPDRRSPVFARNACFQIANDLGLDYHIQFDDDYTGFYYRKEINGELRAIPIKSMDKTIDTMMTFLDVSGATSVAMSQPGDHIGGLGGMYTQPVKRKAMNSFIIRRDRPFGFIGRMNDDVNTYVMHGQRGHLFFTTPTIALVQRATQVNSGGITEFYREAGTYVKSFTTIMMAPSSVVIREMGHVGKRLHHRILWNKAVPKIISEKHKKK